MIVGLRQRISNIIINPIIEVGDSAIKRVIKILRVIIDEILLWNDQIQNTVTKASKGIGMMRRIKKYVPQSTMEKYTTQLYCHI